jgi:hypothetical protein
MPLFSFSLLKKLGEKSGVFVPRGTKDEIGVPALTEF